MKKSTCLLLSLLIFCQYGICGNVPYKLRDIYGNTDPCENPMLKYNMDAIKALDDREFKLYEMQNEKCENYKKALVELKSTNSQNYQSTTQVVKLDETQVKQLSVFVGILIIGIIIFMAKAKVEREQQERLDSAGQRR